MARATNSKKPPRNKDSSKFKGAVEKSAELDKRTGVEHDEGGPVYVEKLSLEERATAGEKLGEKNIELRELEQEGRDAASAQRKKVKALKKVIATLSDEAFEGVRKRPAQQKLPQVEGEA